MDARFSLARGHFDPLMNLRTHFSWEALFEGSHVDAEKVREIVILSIKGDSVAVRSSEEVELFSLPAHPVEGTVNLSSLGIDLAEFPPTLFAIGLGASGRYFCVIDVPKDQGEGVTWVPMRQHGPAFDDEVNAVLVAGFALAAWHRQTRFCAGCGHAVTPGSGGWTLECSECYRIEYPRQDPAIIVRVTDEEDRLLLAHNMAWDDQLWSLPAGFVDAGESPERTVIRELREEVGLEVGHLKPIGSQPWPFPRSMMLAYEATLLNDSPRTPTPDFVEIDEAEFFTREAYTQALTSGRMRPPGPTAIARTIIEEWFGGELPTP